MESIARRLHENKQIELAKSILEAAGYTVSKINENLSDEVGKGTTLSDLIHEKASGNPRFEEIAELVSKKVSELLGAPADEIYVASEDDNSDAIKFFLGLKSAKYQKSEKIGVAGEFVLYEDDEGRKYVYHHYENKLKQFFYA